MNLVKSSWILVEVIVRHPQLNYVESDVGYEVKILAAVSIPSTAIFWSNTYNLDQQTIKKEFERLKTLNLDVPDLEKNAPEPIDLEVWETREKGPNIQPGTRSDDNVWVADHEQIYFQRYSFRR